jgi:hypothetical protein
MVGLEYLKQFTTTDRESRPELLIYEGEMAATKPQRSVRFHRAAVVPVL